MVLHTKIKKERVKIFINVEFITMFLQVFKDVENFKVLMQYVDFFRIDNISLGLFNLGGIQSLCNSRVGMSTARYSEVTILFMLILNVP